MSAERARWVVGVTYRTFAEWVGGRRDRADGGFVASCTFGAILASILFLLASAVRPHLIYDWLSLPSFARLLIPSIVVSLPAFVLERKERAWRWAEEAQTRAPGLNSRRRLVTGLISAFSIACWVAASYVL